MEKEVAVAVIHGMGSQSPGFANGIIKEINDRLGRDAADRVAWQPIYWQDLLEARELRYLRDANRNNDLDAVKLRKFVVTAFGDALAYQRVDSRHNSTYKNVHARVEESVSALCREQLDGESKPLVILAHSLGCQIMSDYIWDMQHTKAADLADLTPFERMQTLAGMITFGCNMPLFTFAYDTIKPIRFPGTKLKPADKAKARWLNFYDPDDILGYPLRAIPAYKSVVNRDIAINVGGFLTSWNPASHAGYWTDNDFTKPATRLIATFLS